MEDDDRAEKKETDQNKSDLKEGGYKGRKATGENLSIQQEMEINKEKHAGSEGGRKDIKHMENKTETKIVYIPR